MPTVCTKLLLLCLLLSMCVPSILLAHPRDCVVRAAEAIDTANATLFTENVDVDALVHSSLEVFLTESAKPEVSRELPPMLAILLSQIQDAHRRTTIRTLLATEVKAYLLHGISSGSFAGKGNANTQQGLLGPLFATASSGRKELIQIAEGFATDKGWCVPCTLLDYGNDTEYPIDALVQDIDGRPMVTGILNLPALFARLRAEAREAEE